MRIIKLLYHMQKIMLKLKKLRKSLLSKFEINDYKYFIIEIDTIYESKQMNFLK